MVRACWIKLSRRIHAWWCFPSIFLKFSFVARLSPHCGTKFLAYKGGKLPVYSIKAALHMTGWLLWYSVRTISAYDRPLLCVRLIRGESPGDKISVSYRKLSIKHSRRIRSTLCCRVSCRCSTAQSALFSTLLLTLYTSTLNILLYYLTLYTFTYSVFHLKCNFKFFIIVALIRQK